MKMKVVSHPEDLLAVLCDPAWRLERVGLEAGPLSQGLFMLIRMLDKRLSVCYRLNHGHNLPNEPSEIPTRFP